MRIATEALFLFIFFFWVLVWTGYLHYLTATNLQTSFELCGSIGGEGGMDETSEEYGLLYLTI